MKDKNALVAGSFDPPTLGHVDIIERASKVCHILYIGIANNSKKKSSFTIKERMAMLAEVCHTIPNIKIIEIQGLVVDCIKERKVDFLVRGLRSSDDFAYEMQMALANKKLCGIETLFLMASPHHAHICSTLIHEIALGGHRLHEFVPEPIEDAVYTRIQLSLVL